ncbi:MAG TPA: citrate/2-methylcitrate synthase [Oceanobacillus sp.]|nr:citrate/2-methylcitrate synthase [Oceanobacillus sp.]
MTAKEVVAALGINAATLYSYVSRGLIRSEPSPHDHRQRSYHAEDVYKLIERKAQRRDPTRAARRALRWGIPVLESALTLITETGLYYRGLDALQLAQEHSLEAVAALLWTGDLDNAATLFSPNPTFDDSTAGATRESPLTADAFWKSLSFIQRMQVRLAAQNDLSAFDLRPENVARTGARILWLNTQAIAPDISLSDSIASGLAQEWQDAHPRLLNAAMILCADHELNASSFAARVVASADANPYAVVIGGLAALQGFKHGGNTRRVRAFLREIEDRGDAHLVIAERLQRGDPIYGFGHPLYPHGDPRARLLLRMLENTHPTNKTLEVAQRIAEEVEQITGEAPNVDFALAVLERALQLPDDAALALFALGRTVGWIGHAIEQYERKSLIRPRAQYTGPQPSD